MNSGQKRELKTIWISMAIDIHASSVRRAIIPIAAHKKLETIWIRTTTGELTGAVVVSEASRMRTICAP
jgi:hypothetical protein